MNNLLKFLWLFILSSFIYVCSERLYADDKTALHLAQCLLAEESGKSSQAKLAAHAWVLRKRAEQNGVSLDDMVIEYCAVFDVRAKAYYSRRARAIRASSIDHPPAGFSTRVWSRVVGFSRHFLAGQVMDPCPAAMHFGNADDVGDKPLAEVCKWLGKRGNKLYKVKK